MSLFLKGRPLPESVWRPRHRGILVLLWIHVFGLAVFAFLAGADPRHAVAESGAVAIMALLAGVRRWERSFAEIMACLGLLTSSALLVHFSGGYIEMHFHFFVMVGLMALYQDWVPFLLAIGYVVVHHGLVGVLEPKSVFNHPAAWSNPWGWAALHGAFILGMSVVSLMAWRLNEIASARSDLILNSAGEGIVGVGEDGRATFANAAAAAMTGWSVAELMGRPLDELLLTPEQAPPWRSPLVRSEGSITVEMVFRRHDGTTFPVECVSAPIEARGAVVGSVVVFNDMTVRKRAEEALRQAEHQLRQAQKMEVVGQLAGGIAHDFNNLLTVILGRSHILLDRLEPSSRLRGNVELISSTATRAGALTQRLLAFSRKQVLQFKELDLNVVVKDTVGMLRGLIGEHIELVTALAPTLGSVRADPVQIEQVIVNLAVNARDAMPQGGTLTIETAEVDLDDDFVRLQSGVSGGPHVMLAVRDTGRGMDANVRAHLFEPFFTTKAPGKGTGLGLATVYGIVKQHDGYIVADGAIGRGATFLIYLPRVLSQSGLVNESLPKPSGGHETILLVEDEELVRDLTAEVLRGNGYTVLAAAPDEALVLAERHASPIHMLLTDVVMPGLNGPELANHLGRIRPGTKILFMSGYADDAVVHHGVFDVHSQLLAKPFQPEDLLRKVREVLDR